MDSTADDQASDNDYIVTADMLIHDDIDDERTLDEEESCEDDGNHDDELEELQKEQDMPLEQLLSFYYGSASTDNKEGVSSTNKEGVSINKEGVASTNKEGVSSINKEGVSTDRSTNSPVHVTPDLLLPLGLLEDLPPSAPNIESGGKKKGPWYRPGANPEALARLRSNPERRSMKLCSQDGHRIVDATFNNWLSHNDSDDSSSDYNDDWRKEIKVGRDYQASVLSVNASDELCTEARGDTLLWRPSLIDDKNVKNYITKINNILERDGLPCGSCDRDNEHALFTLQSCDYDSNKALRIFTIEIQSASVLPSWTDEECEEFESGLKLYGKDFHMIQKRVPTHTVKELIEFYYLWKKTECYDIFVLHYGKMGKRKFILRPGYLSDFMNDYLEPTSTTYPDLHYGTTTLNTELKKDKHTTAHSIDDRLCHTHHNKKIATKATS